MVTRPLLPGGVPFPTTCYLTGPEAVKAISYIEAEGKMKEYNDMLAENEDLRAGYERAHELYLAFRHEIALALEDSEEHIEGTRCRRHAGACQMPACVVGPDAGDG